MAPKFISLLDPSGAILIPSGGGGGGPIDPGTLNPLEYYDSPDFATGAAPTYNAWPSKVGGVQLDNGYTEWGRNGALWDGVRTAEGVYNYGAGSAFRWARAGDVLGKGGDKTLVVVGRSTAFTGGRLTFAQAGNGMPQCVLTGLPGQLEFWARDSTGTAVTKLLTHAGIAENVRLMAAVHSAADGTVSMSVNGELWSEYAGAYPAGSFSFNPSGSGMFGWGQFTVYGWQGQVRAALVFPGKLTNAQLSGIASFYNVT
jgi:hypothetical protein